MTSVEATPSIVHPSGAEREVITVSDEEIEITIPLDGEGLADDANGNGIADGIEVGQAVANAENAAEDAAEASQNADAALEVSEVAIDSAISAEVSAQDANARVAVLENAMITMADQMNALIEITKAQANLAMVGAEQETLTPVEPDSPPENRHWLNRKLFG